MDKKKKIIVTIVGVACIILLAVLLKVFVFPKEETKKRRNQLSISTPKVDEHKIDRKSKLEQYERESFEDIQKNNVVKGFGNLEEEKEKISFEDPTIIGEVAKENNLPKNPVKRDTTPPSYGTSKADDELKQLMDLQEQLLKQSVDQENTVEEEDSDIEDIQKLLETYSQYAQGSNDALIGQEKSIDNLISPDKITEVGTAVSERIAGHITSKFKNKSYFHGAGSGFNQDEVLDLVPAETVDQGVIIQGSTIAIRTKREVRLSSPPVLIPKGAIVYGRVSFGANRLLIDISSYKQGEKLFKLNFNLFDFDGVEGVHLGNRTWPKIPAKVTKDVYDYAYQRGTQAAGFGNSDNGVKLDEAKNIAILSTIKELGNEVFEKRRVFMPKKYHLWFNINTK